MHYRVFSSIFDLYLLGANSIPYSSNKNQKCSLSRITALKVYTHKNLTTEGKYSPFVTEHVPQTEPITVAGTYSILNKS